MTKKSRHLNLTGVVRSARRSFSIRVKDVDSILDTDVKTDAVLQHERAHGQTMIAKGMAKSVNVRRKPGGRNEWMMARWSRRKHEEASGN